MEKSKSDKATIDWSSFRQFVDEFKNESDRAAVVLGAAKLDSLLYQIIQAYLIPSSTGKDELLDGDSPLGTFSSKINFSFRTGLIDSNFARALHLTRKIRNSFAHEVSDCSLTKGAHRDRVRELCLPFKRYDFYPHFKKEFFGDDENPSIEFRASLAIMVGRLENLFLKLEPIVPKQTKLLVSDDWDKIEVVKNATEADSEESTE